MEENNQNLNPTPPVSPIIQSAPIQTPPISNTEKPLGSTEQPAKATKSKLPILIIGIILFLLIAGSTAGFYVFKQQSLKTAVKPTPSPVVQEQAPTSTPDPTANWKTYVSSDKVYSFMYPKEWVIQQSGLATNLTSRVITETSQGIPEDVGSLNVSLTTTEAQHGVSFKTISENDFFNPNYGYWIKGNAGGGGGGTTFNIPEVVTVGGKRAMKQNSHPTTAFEASTPNQITTDYYVWLGGANNQILQISFTYDSKNHNKDSLLATFDQILSTLKFTE